MLSIVTRLMAPITPFVTERVWQDLFVATDPAGPSSVHLAEWPEVDEALLDEGLEDAMAFTRRAVELGRAARAESKVKIRQALKRMLVPSTIFAKLSPELVEEIKQELNVAAVETFAEAGDIVDVFAKGNFRNLGKRFAQRTPKVAAAIADARATVLAERLKAHGKATVVVDGEEVEITPDDVLLTERPREGWSVVNEQGETVALDLELTPELIKAGQVREVTRVVQEARKRAGLEVSDRITLLLAVEPDFAEAVDENLDLIAGEVLATSTQRVEALDEVTHSDDDLGIRVVVTKA